MCIIYQTSSVLANDPNYRLEVTAVINYNHQEEINNGVPKNN
jgi:hypothetical protein